MMLTSKSLSRIMETHRPFRLTKAVLVLPSLLEYLETTKTPLERAWVLALAGLMGKQTRESKLYLKSQGFGQGMKSLWKVATEYEDQGFVLACFFDELATRKLNDSDFKMIFNSNLSLRSKRSLLTWWYPKHEFYEIDPREQDQALDHEDFFREIEAKGINLPAPLRETSQNVLFQNKLRKWFCKKAGDFLEEWDTEETFLKKLLDFKDPNGVAESRSFVKIHEDYLSGNRSYSGAYVPVIHDFLLLYKGSKGIWLHPTNDGVRQAPYKRKYEGGKFNRSQNPSFLKQEEILSLMRFCEDPLWSQALIKRMLSEGDRNLRNACVESLIYNGKVEGLSFARTLQKLLEGDLIREDLRQAFISSSHSHLGPLSWGREILEALKDKPHERAYFRKRLMNSSDAKQRLQGTLGK